jgi:hypothetical protein
MLPLVALTAWYVSSCLLTTNVGVDGVGAGSEETSSCGALELSRLARLVAVALGEVRANETAPGPTTAAETSNAYHLPAVTGPEESSTGPTGGALL